jgi:hypothetical protein
VCADPCFFLTQFFFQAIRQKQDVLDEKLDTLLSQYNATAADIVELLDYVQKSDEQVIAQFAANDSALANSVSFVNSSLSVMSIRLDNNVAGITRHLANIDSTVSNLNYTLISSNNDPNVWAGRAFTSMLPPTVREVTGNVYIDSDTSHLINLHTVVGAILCAGNIYYPLCVANFPALQYASDLYLDNSNSPWNVSMPMLSRVDSLYINICTGNVELPSLLQVNTIISVQTCNSFNVSLPALTTIGGNIQLNGISSFSANNLTHATVLTISSVTNSQFNSLQTLYGLTISGGFFSAMSLRTIRGPLIINDVIASRFMAPNVTTISYYQYSISVYQQTNLWDALPMFQSLQYVDKVSVTFRDSTTQWCMGSTWNYPQFKSVRVGASFSASCLNTGNIQAQLKLSSLTPSCQSSSISLTCGNLS